LIKIGERLKYQNYIYILWVLSIIPLIEIFNNEILAKLVAVQDLYADNINDLLDDKWDVYTSEVDLKRWKNIIQDDKDMHNKYVKLFNKTLAIDITPEGE